MAGPTKSDLASAWAATFTDPEPWFRSGMSETRQWLIVACVGRARMIDDDRYPQVTATPAVRERLDDVIRACARVLA